MPSCALCKMQLTKEAEYHPPALCFLVMAWGEEKARAEIARVLSDACTEEPALGYRVKVFMLQAGRGLANAPIRAEKPRPITSGGRLQGLRRALRRPFFGEAA